MSIFSPEHATPTSETPTGGTDLMVVGEGFRVSPVPVVA